MLRWLVILIFIFSLKTAYPVIPELSIHKIDSYGEFTCAIIRGWSNYGSVKCWGDNVVMAGNAAGNLGTGQWDDRGDDPNEMGNYLPAVNLGNGKFAKDIAVGFAHVCVILNDDTVKCWGDNEFGQLGQGNEDDLGDNFTELGDALPVVDLGTGRTAEKITAGRDHTCALLDDDSLKCWGRNGNGQLGIGTGNNMGDFVNEMGDNLPAVNLGTGRHAVSVVAGEAHTCARLDNGDIKCWGLNHVGQLGQGNTQTIGTNPNDMGDNLSAIDLGMDVLVYAMASNNNHTCILSDDGMSIEWRVKCWGANGRGQLGLGDTNHRGDNANEMGNNLPFIDIGDGIDALDIDLGRQHTCVLSSDNKLRCWGENGAGGLGIGNTNDVGDGPNEMGNNLLAVDLAQEVNLFASGSYHNCATDPAAEKLYCWGWNFRGQLGLGDTEHRGDQANEVNTLNPTELATAYIKIKSLGNGHSISRCMILEDEKNDDYLKCWGGNTGDDPNFIDLGVNGNGHPYITGNDPHEVGHFLPAINLGKDRSPLSVSVGNWHACALLDNNSVKCWGANIGYLGLGDEDPRGLDPDQMGDNLPAVKLGTGRTAKALAMGGSHICAILDNDKVKCWGNNEGGRLGLGDTSDRGDAPGEMGDNLPYVDLGAGRTAKKLALAMHSSCAILDDDSVKCWGVNDSGQLGLGDTNYRGDAPGEMGNNLPTVDLGTGRTAISLHAGGSHYCAHLDNDDIKCWGRNLEGQLGLEDTNDRGDGPGEMGDNLPAIDLAFHLPGSLALGLSHTCLLTITNEVLCWGYNLVGQLGLEDTANRGDGPNEMGFSLEQTNTGMFIPSKLFAIENNTYVITDDTVDFGTGWGKGTDGRLFKDDGDSEDIGDQANEMGNQLERMNINLGFD